jgi:peptidoglycan hydrolase-like protein with peptidoglycan-binding domain
MELLAYIQEEFTSNGVIADSRDVNQDGDRFAHSLNIWWQKFITRSVKLSFNVILASTTLFIGLGSTLGSLAAPSEDIKYVQTLLANNGFDPGAIDGVAGASTRAAIAQAQQSLGLTVDGVAGVQTITALEGGAKPIPSSDAVVSVTNTNNVVSSSTVMNLQKLLADRGFYKGAIDGVLGSQTREAILAAQRAYKLTPDGIAGPRTIAALEADVAVAVPPTGRDAIANAKSDDVLKLQELLSKRGFYRGTLDGIMGPQTRLAIVNAQTAYKLTADGIAGPQTMAALNAGDSSTPSSPKPVDATAGTVTVVVSQDTKELQTLLKQRGFYGGEIDGIKGAQTSAAIIAAQKNYGLTTDGIAGEQTIAALQNDTRVTPPTAVTAPVTAAPAPAGDQNIANLQNLLADRGFYNGPITGVAGPKTRDAIIAAQKAYRLTADGVAGPQTLAALEAGAPTPAVVAPAPIPRSIPVVPQPAVNTPAIQVESKPQSTPSVSNEQPPQPAPVAKPIAPKPVVAANPPASNVVSNPQISELQSLLAKRGFYNGKTDGVLTEETRNAITRAQNFYTISPADGSPSNKLVENLSKDTFISEGN